MSRTSEQSSFDPDLEAAVSLTAVRIKDASTSRGQSESSQESRLDELPPHKAELYRLFGEKANDYLYPKIVERRKTPINNKLRNQGGRAGFDALWGFLRGNSSRKLLQADSKIPDELKDAYSAHARQGLSQGKKPVTRSFSSRVDIPDMERLLDKSCIQNTLEYKHHLGLMVRASQSNEDKMNVLMYNNPPPDLNNMAGNESIDRYLPSWAEGFDKESEASYKKWLAVKLQTDRETMSVEPDSELPLRMQKIPEMEERSVSSGIPTKVDQEQVEDKPIYGSEWDFLRNKRKTKPKVGQGQGKVIFLTEKDARTPGQFSQKFKELEQTKNQPKQFEAVVKSAAGNYDETTTAGSTSRRDTRSASARPNLSPMQKDYMEKYSSKWEPLSLNALVEYKDYQQALGQGDFAHGKPKMFKAAN